MPKKLFGKGGALDKAAKNLHKETKRVAANAAEAVSNGVPAKELDHVKDKNSDEIARICGAYEAHTLTKTIAGHADSFLSFFMGKALNDLTPLLRGEISINHEYSFKTMHMFLTLVDNLHGKSDLNFFIEKSAKEHHSKEAVDFAKNIASKQPLKNEDGSFDITITGYVLEGEILKPGAGADIVLRSSQTNIIQAASEQNLDGQEKRELEIATLNSHETRMEELEREKAAMEAEIAALRANAALKAELEALRAGQNASGSLPTYADATGNQDGADRETIIGEAKESGGIEG